MDDSAVPSPGMDDNAVLSPGVGDSAVFSPGVGDSSARLKHCWPLATTIVGPWTNISCPSSIKIGHDIFLLETPGAAALKTYACIQNWVTVPFPWMGDRALSRDGWQHCCFQGWMAVLFQHEYMKALFCFCADGCHHLFSSWIDDLILFVA